MGRSTLIEPVEWTEDGWYRTVSAATPVTPEQEIKHGLELSDDFKGPQLGLQWTFWKEYAPQSLTFKEDILWMKAKGRTPADGRVLLTTAEDKNYETQVEIRTGNGNVAGLSCIIMKSLRRSRFRWKDILYLPGCGAQDGTSQPHWETFLCQTAQLR